MGFFNDPLLDTPGLADSLLQIPESKRVDFYLEAKRRTGGWYQFAKWMLTINGNLKGLSPIQAINAGSFSAVLEAVRKEFVDTASDEEE
jgi:hypothetical protein